MAINDKIQSITNFFNKIFTSKKENYYSSPTYRGGCLFELYDKSNEYINKKKGRNFRPYSITTSLVTNPLANAGLSIWFIRYIYLKLIFLL
jgi:hypothetical protein